VSIAGFVLIVYGYGEARLTPVAIWSPPLWTTHLAALLTVPAFILLAAAYVPGTRIKRAVGAGVKPASTSRHKSGARKAGSVFWDFGSRAQREGCPARGQRRSVQGLAEDGF
jgi:hypothetical protein